MKHVSRVSATVRVLALCMAGVLAGCESSQATDASAGALGDANVVSFKVDGMACRNCAKELEHEIGQVRGVRQVAIDFDSSMARVAVDPDNPATLEDMQAAVAHWKREHFGTVEDENCLDPEKRKQMIEQQGR